MNEQIFNVEEILAAIQNNPSLSKNIAYYKIIDEKKGEYAPLPDSLEPSLQEALKKRGISSLFTHQSMAIDNAINKKNTVIVTPTASGKTLCYNIPILNEIIKNPEARALYLFPTKALSQDQYNEAYELAKLTDREIKIYTFDGDTPSSARRTIRAAGQIVVTNPDMLHTGILPHHTLWIKLFENLKYIVIDEVHQYRGVFGSHFANVLRRLKRIAQFYNSNPTYIGCSATISNPKELIETLTDEPFEVIDKSGAPQGKKIYIFYNPPIINRELGIRRSAKKEVRRLAMQFLARNIQTIIFSRSRLEVEIITTYMKRAMIKANKNPNLICGYRGGYLPNERREIEKGVKDGRILGVVSTNALELGIDIGQLKVCIMCGYPGTIASAYQQAGRAGRKYETAAVVLIANSSPLNQFMMNNPDYYFGTNVENGIINPENMIILSSHLKCGAFELPFEEREKFGKSDPAPILNYLSEHHIIRHTGNRYYYASEKYPAEEISLRSASIENFVILNVSDNNKALGEVDYDSAPFLIHDDAIYIHQTKTFFIDKLDWERRTAYAREVNTDYYTDAQAKTDIRILHIDNSFEYKKNISETQNLPARPDFPLLSKNLGDLNVSILVTKYKKIKFETQENIGYGDIHLPENELQTEGFWLSFVGDLKNLVEEEGGEMGSGLRALSHLLSNVIPIYVMCDPRDFSVIPMVKCPHTELPSIFVFDRYPGGIGISRNLFFKEEKILKASKELVDRCRCLQGCPSCAGPEIESGDRGKKSAKIILNHIFNCE